MVLCMAGLGGLDGCVTDSLPPVLLLEGAAFLQAGGCVGSGGASCVHRNPSWAGGPEGRAWRGGSAAAPDVGTALALIQARLRDEEAERRAGSHRAA